MGFEEAELLYTIPLCIQGKLEGILFKSKKISSVEDTLVEDIQFAGNASMFLVNPEGKILLVGDKEDRFLLAHNLFDGCCTKRRTEEKFKRWNVWTIELQTE